jgi:hypothetical protein
MVFEALTHVGATAATLAAAVLPSAAAYASPETDDLAPPPAPWLRCASASKVCSHRGVLFS